MSPIGTWAPLAQVWNYRMPECEKVSAQVSGLEVVGQGLARPASRVALPAS